MTSLRPRWTFGLLALLATVGPQQVAGQAIGIGIGGATGNTGTRIGLYSGTFLELPIGAREFALAGAVAATTSGVTAFHWNTAAAADIRSITAALSQNDLYGGSGLKQSYGALAIPVGGASVIGISVNHFSSGEIVRTTELYPEGGDPSAGGVVTWNSMSAGLHAARRMTDRLSVGVTAKYVTEGVDFAKATWLAADFSTIFRTGLFGTTLGASVNNLSGSSHFTGPALQRNIPRSRDVFPLQRSVDVEFKMREANLPTIVQFAIATEVFGTSSALFGSRYAGHAFTVNTAVTDAFDQPITPIIAAEYRLRQVLSLRVGKRVWNGEDGVYSKSYGLSKGIGLSLPVLGRRFTADYAHGYVSSSDLTATQSFTFQFGY
jgi:hypothetical protein